MPNDIQKDTNSVPANEQTAKGQHAATKDTFIVQGSQTHAVETTKSQSQHVVANEKTKGRTCIAAYARIRRTAHERRVKRVSRLQWDPVEEGPDQAHPPLRWRCRVPTGVLVDGLECIATPSPPRSVNDARSEGDGGRGGRRARRAARR
eukprot:6190305-Pleurochrysis_carterae.AAC.1